MSHRFEHDQKQVERIEEWDAHHLHVEGCPAKKQAKKRGEPAIGGRLTHLFTPTSLGVVSVVQCACGARIDVTDYEAW